MPPEANDDLATDEGSTIVTDAGGDKGQAAEATDTTAGKGAATDGKGTETKPADGKGAAQKPAAKTGDKSSIATGGDTEAEDAANEAAAAKEAKEPSTAEQWQKMREEIAKHYAAGDEKAYKKELKRLERVSDYKSVWGMYRELEGKFTSGGLVKIPGKDAKPEDVAAFHKALGVPEKPEDYLKDIKLENGAVIGEADKPLVQAVTAEMHKAGATPAAVYAMINWYYKQQEDQAAAMDEADDTFRREAEGALKDEFGAAFKRKTNAIASLFATAPGGADIKNEGGLYARLMGGRTADGKIIGNDPDMVRFLVSMASEVNPAATVTEDGNQSGVGIDQELANIDKFRRENRPAYNKDYKIQARERELLEAQSKVQARSRA